MNLRYYQTEAVNALLDAGTGSVAVLPTGAGKSLTIAELCKRIEGKIIVTTNTMELIQQNAKTITEHTGEKSGIFCASLGKKNLQHRITNASIQSLYSAIKKGYMNGELKNCTLIIDEAHAVPPPVAREGKVFLETINYMKPKMLLGATATPYRTESGSIVGDNTFFTQIVYDIPVEKLIREGYLSNIHSKSVNPNQTNRKTGTVAEMVTDMHERLAGRKKVLIFGKDVGHCQEIKNQIEMQFGERAEMVSYKTKKRERKIAVLSFKRGDLRFLLSVGIFLVGFDAPSIDSVVLAIEIGSPGKMYQAIGRALRLAPGKLDAIVLDYNSNLERFGPINNICFGQKEIEWMACELCSDIIRKGETCKTCRPIPVLVKRCIEHKSINGNVRTKPSHAPVIGAERIKMRLKPKAVTKSIHIKKKADETESRTLKVAFLTDKGTFNIYLSLDRGSNLIALGKSRSTWMKLAGINVESVQEAADWCDLETDGIEIDVTENGPYWNVEVIKV